VPQQPLNDDQIDAIVQQMRGKGMPQRMRMHRFGESRPVAPPSCISRQQIWWQADNLSCLQGRASRRGVSTASRR
jgi:hypothetical protein